MTAPAGYRFKLEVPVRFRDLDPMGHAHHGQPLVYLEEARAAYWRDVVGRDGLDGIDYVMAEVNVQYHARIGFPDTLTVWLRTSRVGNKSFEQEFDIRSGSGEKVASGRTVQVMYDYAKSASKPVPPEVRERIDRFERGG